MAGQDTTYITVGKIGAPYGVRGWVKVYSYTETVDNLLHYVPWYIRAENAPQAPWQEAVVSEAKAHGKGIVAKLAGCEDRDDAAALRGREIAIRRDQLPPPAEGEYYWIDLQGLEVQTLDGVSLGIVDHLLETGANDVLVVKGERERLIPYVQGPIVKEVDLDRGVIRVDWDPDYE
jgi:16S rRNA processing protein RimM